MAGIQGTRSTGNINQTQIAIDIPRNRIDLLDDPDQTPLIVIMKQMRAKETINPKFFILEKELKDRSIALIANANIGDPTLEFSVADAANLAEFDVLKNARTGEISEVVSVDYATGIATVTRAVTAGGGGTAEANMLNTDEVLIIGNVNAEGADLKDIVSRNATEIYNYCQIFRTPFGVTNTEDATELYSGNDLAQERREKLMEHHIEIESSILFGERTIINSGTKPKRYMGGVIQRVTTNVLNNSGNSLTEAIFETYLRSIFRYGATKRLLVASPLLVSIINSFSQNKLNTLIREETYGVAISEYLNAHGQLYIVKHNLLSGSVFGAFGIALTMDKLTYRYLRGRDTRLLTNRQGNGADEMIEEYLTECSLELANEQHHGIIRNFTA